MISVVLYGRNDNYGYNLHKRAALSLNTIAELLTGPTDEILFVDYNTPDDHPTFPESIRDTLTQAARSRLRIFRVRPRHHARFRPHTHLFALEPVARNVAVRRANPANPWLLSTNTDMIFVPRRDTSLTGIATPLSRDAFYHLPRFEIPETLWESLDRADPAATIAQVAHWGTSLCLNEIVYGDKTILYDAPGDFQLVPRERLVEIGGFDERMLRGWHLDSNLARRLGLLLGPPRSLVNDLFGYHCDHTRQATPMHSHGRVENDLQRFVNDVSSPHLPDTKTWGLAGETIEELRLDTPARYPDALRRAVGQPITHPLEIRYDQTSYDQVGYDPRHVAPFLLDALAAYPPETRIVFLAAAADLLRCVAAGCQVLGLREPLRLPDTFTWLGPEPPEGCVVAPWPELEQAADIVICDFGPVPIDADKPVVEPRRDAVGTALCRLAWAERTRPSDTGPRRFIAVNAVHGRFERLVRFHIAATLAPIATRLRQGPVNQRPAGPIDLLPSMEIGPAGRREPDGLCIEGPGRAAYGPYIDIQPGSWRLRLRLEPLGAALPATAEIMLVEVVAEDLVLALARVRGDQLNGGTVTIPVVIPEQAQHRFPGAMVEVRLTAVAQARLRIRSIDLQPGLPADAPTPLDWMPRMLVGRAGKPVRGTWNHLIRRLARAMGRPTSVPAPWSGARAGWARAGHVLYGPYCTLLPGRYRLELDIEAKPRAAGRVIIEVRATNGTEFARLDTPLPRPPGTPLTLDFTIPEGAFASWNPARAEFRLTTTGRTPFTVRALRTTKLP